MRPYPHVPASRVSPMQHKRSVLSSNTTPYRRNRFILAALLVMSGACSEEVPPGGGGVCQDNLGCRTGTICIRTACIPVASVDQDGDGIPDSVEERLGTDPQRRDSDNDGLPDGQEVRFDEERNDWNAPDADDDGRPGVLPTHPPSPLGRIPKQILQRNWIGLQTLQLHRNIPSK